VFVKEIGTGLYLMSMMAEENGGFFVEEIGGPAGGSRESQSLYCVQVYTPDLRDDSAE
jgi:hypothetical protein